MTMYISYLYSQSYNLTGLQLTLFNIYYTLFSLV